MPWLNVQWVAGYRWPSVTDYGRGISPSLLKGVMLSPLVRRMSWKAYCLLASEFPPKHKMMMIRQNALEKWPVRRYFSRGFQKSSPPTQEGATIQNLSSAR
ncbi:MAG: hypothetical protein PHC30_03520 [Lentisphaeria bacterium]|nr:hypothetical protein [Lentisphaeria bacterium]